MAVEGEEFYGGAANFTTVLFDSGSSLEEIVIVAERRKENLQDAPITVTAVSAAALESAGVSGTTELANAISGLTMPQSQGTPMPHIRGVGNTALGTGIENSVALYVDGVYHGSASFSALTFNNIAQLEVAGRVGGDLRLEECVDVSCEPVVMLEEKAEDTDGDGRGDHQPQ